MNQQEFDEVIAAYRKKGISDEDIALGMTRAFQAKRITRNAYEAILGALGFYLDKQHASLSDEELIKAIEKELK